MHPEGGNGLTYSAIGLPASLSISPEGLISGTTPKQGHYQFTITLKKDAGCTTDDVYTINTNAPLPVTYSVPLKAAVVNNAVRLDWQTATESNNSHFIVQRSTNRTTWESIGTVNSFFATGTGSGQAYAYTDENPLQGNNFYRLQQVDISGNAEVSSIASASLDRGGIAIMYISPNPTKGNIKIHNLPANASVHIVGINGNTYTFPVNDGNMNVGSLPTGIYFVQISVANSVVAKLKFVKQ
jgi:hypothetical protein